MIDTNKLRENVGKLEENHINILLDQFTSSSPDSAQTWKVVEAIQQGIEIVGSHFETGRYCAGDLIFAGELVDISMKKLKPLLGIKKNNHRCMVVLGTVEGDVHDIGKNILKTLLEISGFKVEDLGIDQKPLSFVDAVREHHPQILGLSGVLTLAIPSMKRTVEAIIEAGLRENLKIIIGGNSVNEEICHYVGADAWNKNAVEAINIYKSWSD